jgi:isoamyl acetate esterase
MWMGANDATFFTANVPLEKFLSNLRTFIDAFLTDEATKEAKIILLTPPPINCSPAPGEESVEEARERMGPRTWVNKMRYADAIVKLVGEYGKNGMADRVGCVDVWRGLVNWALNLEGREPLKEDDELTRELVEKKLPPGCGLPGMKRFPDGTFTDGLHFGTLVSKASC